MMKFLLVAASVAFASSPAVAADTSKPSDEAKMVCKRIGGTGWRLGGQKVCKTKAEWQAEELAQRDAVSRSRGSGGSSAGD